MSVSVPNSAQLELKGSVRLSFTTNQATQDMIFNQIPKLSFHIGVLHISAPGSSSGSSRRMSQVVDIFPPLSGHFSTIPDYSLSSFHPPFSVLPSPLRSLRLCMHLFREPCFLLCQARGRDDSEARGENCPQLVTNFYGVYCSWLSWACGNWAREGCHKNDVRRNLSCHWFRWAYSVDRRPISSFRLSIGKYERTLHLLGQLSLF